MGLKSWLDPSVTMRPWRKQLKYLECWPFTLEIANDEMITPYNPTTRTEIAYKGFERQLSGKTILVANPDDLIQIPGMNMVE